MLSRATESVTQGSSAKNVFCKISQYSKKVTAIEPIKVKLMYGLQQY